MSSLEGSSHDDTTHVHLPTPTVRPVRLPTSASRGPVTNRYEELERLGAGGMAEVVELHDIALGRYVARKRMTTDDTSSRARFLREVRIQAQLEHPSIVPVYDIDEHDETTFTMKRVQGVTLSDAAKLARRDEAEEEFAPRRLMEAIATTCLAIDYAHRRGVVHRDLKPSNIMLGHWGEVYVLDWGVARVLDADEEDSLELAPGDAPHDHTTLVGTPGYIAPEMLEQVDRGSARTDVYALGATLFFVLSGASLHSGSPRERYASTLAGVDIHERLAVLGVTLPPELMAILWRATAPAHKRFETARALHDAIKRYLDGNRDRELRRDMADRMTERADARLARIAEREDRNERRAALRELVSALALTPSHPAALRQLVRLLTEPPREIPAVVSERIERIDAMRIAALGIPTSVATLVLAALLMAIVVVLGVRSWMTVGLAAAGGVTSAISMWVEGKAALGRARAESVEIRGRRRDTFTLVALAITIAALTGVFSPWLVLPSLAVGITVMRMVRDHRQPSLVAALMIGAVLVPWALQGVGLLPASLAFVDSTIVVRPVAVDYPPLATQTCLVVTVVMSILVATVVPGRFRRALRDAESQNALRSWQLEQLLPDDSAAVPAQDARLDPGS